MSELLLELFSEEIPARMQARAADDLRRLVVEGVQTQGLAVGEAMAFATPRRLALVVQGVASRSPAISEERKGPRVGAPEQALAGFLKSAGLASIGEARSATDPSIWGTGIFQVCTSTSGTSELAASRAALAAAGKSPAA